MSVVRLEGGIQRWCRPDVVIDGFDCVDVCDVGHDSETRQMVTKGENKDSYDGCRETSGVGRGDPSVAEREIDAKRVHKNRLWSGRAGKSLESMNREEGDLH